MSYTFFHALSFPTTKRKPTPRELFISTPSKYVTLEMWLAADGDRYSWIHDQLLFEKLYAVTGTYCPHDGALILRTRDLRAGSDSTPLLLRVFDRCLFMLVESLFAQSGR